VVKLTHDEAVKLAQSEWDAVFRVDEVETKPGAVVRNIEGAMAKHYGKAITQQWKVSLHSSTGPVHYIAVLADGGAVLK
jgi:hypothetical protein